MADHGHGDLAEIEEGRSLLPEIVQAEHELQQRLEEAETEAADLIKTARAAKDQAVADAKAGFPEKEQAFLDAELKKYEGELEELEKAEKARLDDLREAASSRVGDAAKAVAALALKTGN